MPRPAKAARRQKVNAAIEYKKGNRKEAYKLWEEAAKSRKERLAAKQFKHKKAADEAAGADADSSAASGSESSA